MAKIVLARDAYISVFLHKRLFTHLYRHTERPLSLGKGYQNITDEFQRVLNKFDLLLCTRKVDQHLPPGHVLSNEEVDRRENIAAYTKQYLDID